MHWNFAISCRLGNVQVFSDLWAFITALYNRWSAILLGSVVALGLGLWFGFGRTIPPLGYGVIVLCVFLWSVFRVWRDQFREFMQLSQEHRAFVADANDERQRMQERLDASTLRINDLAARAGDARTSAVWRPAAAINSYERGHEIINELILKDEKYFQIDAVALADGNGAKVASIPYGPPDLYREAHVHITHQQILELTNRRITTGKVLYSVSRGPAVFQGDLPVRVEQIVVKSSGTPTFWSKLIG